jgi:VWFA-related protein
MRHSVAAAVATMLAAIGVGSRALADEPRTVRESIDVTVVEVPVRVLDRSGEPVRGLTAADFTLIDQGRPQTITAVDAIELGDSARPVERGSVSSAARRRYLLLFDFAFARPNAVVAARRAAKEFVLDGMRDSDLTAIGTYSAQTGVRLLVTFSSDRVALAEAIETLGLEPTERSDPLQLAYRPRRLPAASVAGDASSSKHTEVGTRRQTDFVEIVRTMAALERSRTDDYERARVKSLIQGLRDLGKVLDVVEGRKEIVLLSEGFPSRLLSGAPETREEQQWMLKGDVWKVDSDRRYGNSALRSDLSEMGEFLKRTQCVIHTVDIAGLAGEADRAAPAELGTSVPRATENALFDLSSETGGESFRGRNDIEGELRRLARRTSLVYVLAYRPDRREGEGKYHALKVKVDRSGVRVVSRPGYFERSDFRKRTPFERSLSAADILTNEIPFSEIGPRVLATPFPGAAPGAEARLSVAIEIPGGELLQGETGERTTLEIYAYAFDGTQRVADFLVEPLGLDVPKAKPRLASGGLRYLGELRLPPGEYRLRTLVRNANTGRTGLAVTSVRVPSFAAGEPYLLDPVFLETESANWFPVRGTPREGQSEPPVPPLDALVRLGGDNAVPAAMAHLAPGSTAKVCLVAYHFGEASGNADALRIGTELLAADGRALAPGTISLLRKTPVEPDGRRVFILAFTAPPDLIPGRYGLRVFLEDSSTSRRGEASAVFVVP